MHGFSCSRHGSIHFSVKEKCIPARDWLSAVDEDSSAIACVLLGGASIAGGSGGVGGTALGVLFLSTLGNGLSLSGISSYWQGVVTGVILVGAVLLNRISDRGLSRPFRRANPPSTGAAPDAP